MSTTPAPGKRTLNLRSLRLQQGPRQGTLIRLLPSTLLVDSEAAATRRAVISILYGQTFNYHTTQGQSHLYIYNTSKFWKWRTHTASRVEPRGAGKTWGSTSHRRGPGWGCSEGEVTKLHRSQHTRREHRWSWEIRATLVIASLSLLVGRPSFSKMLTWARNGQNVERTSLYCFPQPDLKS